MNLKTPPNVNDILIVGSKNSTVYFGKKGQTRESTGGEVGTTRVIEDPEGYGRSPRGNVYHDGHLLERL